MLVQQNINVRILIPSNLNIHNEQVSWWTLWWTIFSCVDIRRFKHPDIRPSMWLSLNPSCDWLPAFCLLNLILIVATVVDLRTSHQIWWVRACGWLTWANTRKLSFCSPHSPCGLSYLLIFQHVASAACRNPTAIGTMKSFVLLALVYLLMPSSEGMACVSLGTSRIACGSLCDAPKDTIHVVLFESSVDWACKPPSLRVSTCNERLLLPWSYMYIFYPNCFGRRWQWRKHHLIFVLERSHRTL